MITATEARKLTDEILEPVSGSIEFKAIMAAIERKIRKAIANGLEEIEIISYTLQVLNGNKFPKCINRDKINKDHFWWPYVKTELEENGFTISNTPVCDHYIVSW
jgi:hypothetical protein